MNSHLLIREQFCLEPSHFPKMALSEDILG